jgi:adenosine kinase
LLDKYGLKANDAILADPEKHMDLYEDLLQNYNAVLIAGGAAQNTARGAQYMLAPNSTVYIGCIGKDKYGETLEKISSDAGVKTEYLYDEKTPTGRCGVVITGHNRSMCTDLAAANNYKVDHLKQEHIWKQVENAQVFYVGGFHLTVCVPAIKALAEEAAAKNKVRLFPRELQRMRTDNRRSSSSTFPHPSSPNSSRTRSTRSCLTSTS